MDQNINPNVGSEKKSVAQKAIVIALWVAILGVVVWLFGFKYPVWQRAEPPQSQTQLPPDEYSANGTITKIDGFTLSFRVSKLSASGKWLLDEIKNVRFSANTPITKITEQNYKYTATKLTFRDLKEGMNLAVYSASDPSGASEISATRIEVVR